ncbi:MAG: hypothetical protein ACI9OJ_003161 [Myxococcota bacterium]|jgi:hypothetical protein
MSRFTRLTIIVTTAALAVWSGCGESDETGVAGDAGVSTDGGDIIPAEDTGADMAEPDTFAPPEDMVVQPPDGVVLDFQTVNGDDDAPCKSTGRCAIIMSINSSRDLLVMATQDGGPVNGLEVAWEITKDPQAKLALGSSVSYTGSEGKTQTSINQIAQEVAQYEVKVSIRNSDAAPIYFDITINTKGIVPLTVSYDYTGKRNFQAVTTYLFKHTADKLFPCSAMNPNQIIGADLSHAPISLTQAANFPQLPDLETEMTQKYSIVGIGKDSSGPVLVWGCDDTKGDVSFVGSTSVKIPLNNTPPKWSGKDFEVTTKFDLVSALPENVAGIVNTVLGFFTDPAGQLLVLVCDLAGDVTGIEDLCNFVFQDPDNPCLEPEDACFDTVGIAIKTLVTDLLNSLLEGNIGGDIFFTGQDVAKILKGLEMKATMRFVNEPKADGTFTTDDTEANWHTVRYRWTLGTNCAPDDYACGWRDFNVSSFQDDVIDAPFSGRVDYTDDDEFRLTIDKHSLKVNYGSLLLYLIEKQLLPLIGGDGSEPNSVKVDSFEEYLKSLVGSDECLVDEQLNGVADACCNEFAASIGGSTTVGTSVALQGCKLSIPLASQEIGKLLTGLDLETGDAFTLATKSPCLCADPNNDLTIDAWGTQALPCVWDTELNVGGTTVLFDNEFWAVEAQ